MKIETNDYITVNNYSKIIHKSVTWVYRLIAEGKVKSVIIDGIKFVKND